MNRALFILIGLAAALTWLGNRSEGQVWNGRASEAIDALPGVAGVVTQEAMEETVVPFTTDNPPEASIEAEEIEDEILNRRTGGTVEADAYQMQADSVFARPQVTLDPNILDVADDAVENAPDVLGGIIDPTEDQCAALSVGPQVDGEFMCHITDTEHFQFCAETRQISVDRRDAWSCRRQTASFTRGCNRSVNYQCVGESGATCLENNLVVSGGTTNPFGNGVYRLAGDIPTGPSDCKLSATTFFVDRQALITLDSLHLFSGVFDGAGQILVNGSPIATVTPDAGLVLGANSELQIVGEDCGAGCFETVVYAGSERLGVCNDPAVLWNHFVDLRSFLPNDAAVIPPIVTNAPVQISMPERSVQISLLQASSSPYNAVGYVHVSGSCCASMIGQGSATC